MLQHLLYIVAPKSLANAKSALNRLGAIPTECSSEHGMGFRLSHKVIGDMILEITLITSLDDLVAHFKQYPVDLLIYDERFGGADAVIAVKKIIHDVQAIASLWGPDFYFPASRIVVILRQEESKVHKKIRRALDSLDGDETTGNGSRWTDLENGLERGAVGRAGA